MGKQFSSDLKMKAVKYYHKVDNYSKVCKIFEYSERVLNYNINITRQLYTKYENYSGLK